jgi:hypothetical protein
MSRNNEDDNKDLLASIHRKQDQLRAIESKNGKHTTAPCNTESTENAVGTENADNTDNTDNTENTTPLRGRSVFSAPTAPSVLQDNLDDVETAIAATLPLTKGEAHCHVFRLARYFKGIPSLRNADAATLRPFVEAWYRRALPLLDSKPFLEVWADFVQAWKKVKVPVGEGVIHKAFVRAKKSGPPPMVTELYGAGPIGLLAALCRELQGTVGDREFFLDCRTAGRLIGVDHTTAWRYLEVLCADGILKAGAKGSKTTRKASSFRYIES